MSDANKLKNTKYVPNFRYEINTKAGFKSFSGLLMGKSDDIYLYNGKRYTANHKLLTETGFKNVCDLPGAIKVDEPEIMYEPLEVDGDHTYKTVDENVHENCLILDEFAFVGDGSKSDLAQEFIKSVFPTISSAKDKKNSKIIIISTPNGLNSFYQIYSKAQKGKNDFTHYKINWRSIPRSDPPEIFREKQINTIGEVGFSQEYACVGSATHVTIKYGDEVRTLTIEELESLLLE
jgi:hypothetical protein